MNALFSKLIKELQGTKRRMRDVCEDLGMDPHDLVGEDIGVYLCNSCGIWHKQLIEDFDGNFICTYCENLVGL